MDQPNESSKLGIVIVNFNSHAMISKNFGDLELDESLVSIVVVDSYANDAEAIRMAEVADQHGWDLVTTGTNVGFGGGMNRGVAYALASGATELLLVNPDVRLTVSDIHRMWEAARNERSTLFCPVLRRPDGRVWFGGGQIDLRTGRTRNEPHGGVQETNGWLTGACLALSSTLWSRLGGFDERYFMYWEDIDFSYRCQRSGGDLHVLDDVEVVHEVGATQGSERKSNLYTYHVCRNRLLFAAIHLDRLTKIRWVVHTPRESWRIAIRDGRRSTLSRPTYLYATLLGSLSGVLSVGRSLFNKL